MAFCGNCGNNMQEDTMFCSNCGWNKSTFYTHHPTQTEAMIQTVGSAKKKHSVLIILIISALIITITIILVIFSANMLNPENKAEKIFCKYADACKNGDIKTANELYAAADFEENSFSWEAFQKRFTDGYTVLLCDKIDEDDIYIGQVDNSDIDKAYLIYFYSDYNLQIDRYCIYSISEEWFVYPYR